MPAVPPWCSAVNALPSKLWKAPESTAALRSEFLILIGGFLYLVRSTGTYTGSKVSVRLGSRRSQSATRVYGSLAGLRNTPGGAAPAARGAARMLSIPRDGG